MTDGFVERAARGDIDVATFLRAPAPPEPQEPTVVVPLNQLADLLAGYARASAGREWDRDDLTVARADDAYDALAKLITLKAVH